MRIILTISFLISTCVVSFSQGLYEVFNSDIQITWLGVDYSQAKMIGAWSHFNGAGEQGPEEIRDKYYPAWNNLILEESDKYNISNMIRQDDIIYDIDIVMARNADVSIQSMEANEPPFYNKEYIQGVIDSYDLDGKSGTGIVFINEYMSKSSENAVFHFVLLDMSSKKILLYQKCWVEPFGFGIRNYWAGSILNVMKQIRKSHYKRWKKQFSN